MCSVALEYIIFLFNIEDHNFFQLQEELLSHLPNFILVEMEGYAFNVNIQYKIFPLFYSFCHVICQSLENCRAPNISKSRKERCLRRHCVSKN